ncbi:MAG: hypothetical protein IKM00_00685 [Clostridia bacterium]|nr:hypothetical protein [Clostridia bacterium]MBR6743721.1 hypothetical protein [Clostridia bacterium]
MKNEADAIQIKEMWFSLSSSTRIIIVSWMETELKNFLIFFLTIDMHSFS